MKNISMKKYTFIAAASAILMALSFSSCKKDDGSVTLKIKAVKAGVDAKQKNYIDNDTLILEVGDKVKINGSVRELAAGSEGGTEVTTGHSSDGYALLYPAGAGSFTCNNTSGSGSVSIPATQSYTLTNANKNQKLEIPMLAFVANENQVVKFRNAASVVKVMVRNCNANTVTVNSVTISGANLCGNLPFSFNTATNAVTPGALSNAGATVTLNCSTTIAAASSKAFHIVVAPFAASQQLTITVNTGTNVEESQTTTQSLLVGQMGIFEFILGNDIPACTQALFSVSATQKVSFSPGNLQRKGSTTNWQLRFAPNQWDKGTAISYKNTGEPSDVDAWYGMFSWGTGNQAASYVGTASSFVDYGTNSIQLGATAKKYKANYWRTLTGSEWKYLCENEARGSKRFIDCRVHDQYGLIIFPDGYNYTDITIMGTINNSNNYSINTNKDNSWKIADSDWVVLEKRGCVFLPAMGTYSSGSTSNNTFAVYCRSDANGGFFRACRVAAPFISNQGKLTQVSVRLVHNVVGF